MHPLKCEEILKAASGRLVRGDSGTIFTGVSTDSRKTAPGDLFVPIRGERFDGHDFIGDAFKAGAKGSLTHKEIARENGGVIIGGVIIEVDNTLRALGAIAGYYRSKFDLPVVAVTGSVGKTSTKDMIACVLSEKYKVLRTEGNFNNEIGLPLTLLNLDRSHTAAVVEMGMNQPNEISKLTRIARPRLAVITNIGSSHIGKLGSKENILKAKLEILEGLTGDGTVVLNADDGLLAPLYGKLPFRTVMYGIAGNGVIGSETPVDGAAGGGTTGNRVTGDGMSSNGMTGGGTAGNGVVCGGRAGGGTASNGTPGNRMTGGEATGDRATGGGPTGGGTTGSVNYIAYDVRIGERGTCFKTRLKGTEYEIVLNVPGIHNVSNAMAAIAVGAELGLEPGSIVEGISHFKPEKLRLNFIECGGIMIINDAYNASPESMKAAIGVLKEMKASRRIAVLGDMLELGQWAPGAHFEVGKIAAGAGIDYIIAVGSNAADIAEGAAAAGASAGTYVFDDAEKAAEFVIELVKEGDGILVKGSRGMRMERIVDKMIEKVEK
jgi:UDP-N-acetylmuramoyl-tripeptide--D-alanyl-D-alanine ligase